MLAPKTKRIIKRILPFGLIWLLFGVIYVLLEKGLLANLGYYPATGIPYTFGLSTIFNVFAGGLIGIFVGTMEIFVLSKIFVKRSFGFTLLLKTIVYALIMISFLVILSSIDNAVKLDTTVLDPRVWTNIASFFSTYTFWSLQFYFGLTILVSLFFAEVSDSVGSLALSNFFFGKYHRPQQEERIFMFLDMRSSTTIAQILGHIKYFKLLNRYYADLTDAIVDHEGEVYQYVGDEIIITWILKDGIRNNNCINCFFAMKKALNDRKAKYERRFGIMPTFKAGLHCGAVTTGEIGVIKKEIVFSGDVLNTTSRIQELCNKFGEDFICSSELQKHITNVDHVAMSSLGDVDLRGRNKLTKIFAIEENDDRPI